MNSKLLKALVVSLAIGAATADASPITVPNASFDSSVPGQTSTNPNVLPGWFFNVKNGSAYGSESISSNFFSPGASTGSYAAFINNDYPGVTDTLSSAASLGTIAPLTTYTLTVAIGNRQTSDTSLYGSPGNVSFSLLANGVAFATTTVNNGTVVNGTFQDFTLTYTTGATGSIIGDALKVQLATLPEQGSAYQPAFDNVTLDATALPVIQADPVAVPEPTTCALMISGLLGLLFVARRKHSIGLEKPRRSTAVPLILGVLVCGTGLIRAEAIKTLPLDDQTVYRLKIGTDKVTTLFFPQPITALEGSGLTSDAKIPAKMLLSYHAGDRFLSLRSLADSGVATLNVIISRKVYVVELTTDKDPVQSVTFYPADEPPAQSAGQPNIGPNRLLSLLDKAKAYPLLAEQYPEMVSQIDKAEPFSQTLYEGFHVILTKVLRFDAEDALIFQIEFVNETDQPITYIPQSLAVRVGSGVYWSALSDASGIIPAGVRNPKTAQIDPGHSHGYFVICGTPHGGRNHLAVQNAFNVLVFRQENS